MMKRAKWTVGAVLATLIVFMGIMLVSGITKQDGTETVSAAGSVISSPNKRAKASANMKGIDYSNAWNDEGYTARGCTTGNNFYYSIYNTLYKMNLKTGKSYVVKELDCFNIRSVKYYNQKLYIVIDEYAGTGGSYPYIECIDVDGNNQTRLGVGYSVTIANNKIYYIKQKAEKSSDTEVYPSMGIYSMDLAGQGEKKILSSSTVSKVVCDGASIFYRTDKGTYQMSLIGNNRKKILSASQSIIGYYDNTIYYESYNYKKQIGSLYAKNKKTGKVKKIATDIMQYVSKVDALTGKLYYIKEVKYGKKCPVYQYNIKTGKKVCVAKQKKLYSLGVYGADIMLTYTNDSSDTISKMVHLSDKKVTKLATYFVS